MPKIFRTALVLALMTAGLLGCGKKPGKIADAEIARFVAAKRVQAKEIAAAQTNRVPQTIWKFFDAVERNDFKAATNLSAQLQSARSYNPRRSLPGPLATLGRLVGYDPTKPRPPTALDTELWSVYVETVGICEVYHGWDNKWLRRFAYDVIDSIPSNSIYFGGTDPGRFAISAYSQSHREGRPFFTLTQNALADGTYLDYLRTMYGGRIQIATPADSQQAFKEYLDDAQLRMQKQKLKPGEDVRIIDNRVQVSGQVAVMEINGLIAKTIVEKNSGREFYLEESFPLEWMYPHLEPHGLIFKLHHAPLKELSEQTVARDRDYWKRYAKELIGDWLTEKTSVKEVCDFGEKVYLRKDLAGFAGDAGFARNDSAQKTFSKLRSSIGGLYAWRAEHAGAEAEKQRMTQEADFAFRQALALCPYSPEAVFRYVNLLLAQKRNDEALLVAQLMLKLSPTDPNAKDLVNRVQKLK